MTLQPVIVAKSVVAVFERTEVNEPVSFELGAGQLGVLRGGNGSGKTTLLRVITGQVKSHATRLEVMGITPPVEEPWVLMRERIRMIPQFPVLPSFLTLDEYLAVWRSCTPRRTMVSDTQDAKHLTDRLATLVGISPKVRIGTLSFGQRRLVEIVLACEAEPDLILADEPLAGLSRQWIPTAVSVLETFRSLGRAVLMVVHDAESQFWQADWTVTVFSSGRRS